MQLNHHHHPLGPAVLDKPNLALAVYFDLFCHSNLLNHTSLFLVTRIFTTVEAFTSLLFLVHVYAVGFVTGQRFGLFLLPFIDFMVCNDRFHNMIIGFITLSSAS